MSENLTPNKKALKIKELNDFIKKFDSIGIAGLYKVRASQLQELKKKLEGSVSLKVVKNSLMRRALVESKDESTLKKLEEYLTGSNIFLFTNLNPFKVSLLLEKNKVKAIAKAGDAATEKIQVSAGNTGFPPGPIISQFNSVGLTTRIESGSVWVNKDTTVAKKGDIISEKLAIVLSKLGIKGIETGLRMKMIYDNGSIITEKDLNLDLEEFGKNIGQAYTRSMGLSIEARYPTTDNISQLFSIVQQESLKLGIEASILSPDLIKQIIQKSCSESFALKAIIDSA